MTRMPLPPRQLPQGVGWTFIALILSAASAAAGPPVASEVAKPLTRGVQIQAEPATPRQQAAQEASQALGQRLDQMLLDLRSAPAR